MARIKLQNIYQEQELKLLEEEILVAKRFLEQNDRRYAINSICLVLGPSRFGKSTLLSKSGLTLLDCDYNNVQQQSGITTTKSCVFWFGERTIFIDTAGVYTRPDFASEQSSELWLGFINLLQRHFGKHLIRDVVLVLDVPTLLNEQLLGDTLDCLRRRVYEVASLTKKLQLHLIITKCDRILGFNDYFAALEAKECKQPLGIVFEQVNQNSLIAEFESGFKLLLQRLNHRLIDQLQYGAVGSDPVLVKAFPSEFAQLHTPLLSALSKIPYGSHIRLCGMFFVSSCQHGEVLDPIKRLMNDKIGTNDQSDYAPEYLGNRDYFIHEFFRRLNEQYAHELTDDSVRNRNIWVVLIVAVAIAISGWLVGSYCYNMKQLKEWRRQLTILQYTKGELPAQLTSKAPWWVSHDTNSFLNSLWRKGKQDYWLAAIGDQLATDLVTRLDAAGASSGIENGNAKGVEDAVYASELITASIIYEQFNAYLMLTGMRPWSENWLKTWLERYSGAGQTIDENLLSAHANSRINLAVRPKLIERVTDYLNRLPAETQLSLIAMHEMGGRKDLMRNLRGAKLTSWQMNRLFKEILLRAERSDITQIMRLHTPLNSDIGERMRPYFDWFIYSYNDGGRSSEKSSFETRMKEFMNHFSGWMDDMDLELSYAQQVDWQPLKEQLHGDLKEAVSSTGSRSGMLSRYLKGASSGYGVAPFDNVEIWLKNNQPKLLDLYHLWQSSFWDLVARWLRQEMVEHWNREVAPFYQQKIASCYPFAADSKKDVVLGDFTAFFGPHGIVNRYYREWVVPFCTFSGSMPSWMAPSYMLQTNYFPLEILEATVRADLIAKIFYVSSSDDTANGKAADKIGIAFTALSQSRATADDTFQINLDGQLLDAQEEKAQHLRWPGPQAGSVVIRGKDKNGNYFMHSAVGDWAWFRVLEQSRVIPVNPKQFEVIFEIKDDKGAVQGQRAFTINVNENLNPFDLKLLRGAAFSPITSE